MVVTRLFIRPRLVRVIVRSFGAVEWSVSLASVTSLSTGVQAKDHLTVT